MKFKFRGPNRPHRAEAHAHADGLSGPRMVALGFTLGAMLWAWWTAVLLAHRLQQSTGLHEGDVGFYVIFGCVLGKLPLTVEAIGRRRKEVATVSAGGAAIPMLALAVGGGPVQTALALVLMGVSIGLSDTAGQSLVVASIPEQARLLRMAFVWLPKTIVIAVGGPLWEWFVPRVSLGAAFGLHAVVAVAAAVAFWLLCPEPALGARRLAFRGLWTVIAASACVEAQYEIFGTILPLEVTRLDIQHFGWTQFGLPIGSTVVMLVSLPRARWLGLTSAPRTALAGAVGLIALSALALVTLPFTTGAWAIFAVAATLRTLSFVTSSLQRNSLYTIAGADARGSAAIGMAGDVGSIAFLFLAGRIWDTETIASSHHFPLVVLSGIPLGVIGLATTVHAVRGGWRPLGGWRTLARRRARRRDA